MGTVYEVERVTDGKHFALKALAGGGGALDRARFAREGQIVANVNHPNVVSFVDFDVAKGGFIFLVMELVIDGAFRTGGTAKVQERAERFSGLRLPFLIVQGSAVLLAGSDAASGPIVYRRVLRQSCARRRAHEPALMRLRSSASLSFRGHRE